MTTPTPPISSARTAPHGAPPRTNPHAQQKWRNEPNPLTRAITATLPPIPRLNPFVQNEPTPAPQGAPPRTKAHHPTAQTNKTNPTPPSTPFHHSSFTIQHSLPVSSPTPPFPQNKPTTPLPPAQLAALRLLLAGHRPGSVAASLGIDRHTLLRWRRSPAFSAELLRLHTQLLSPH